MDGIHDMGGMQGFGEVVDEPETMGFHADWHGRMFALSRVVRYSLPFGGDHVRQAIERMAPRHYLRSSYYEKWLEGNIACLAAIGVVSEAELAGGPVAPLPAALAPPRPMAADAAAAFIFGGMAGARPSPPTPPRFKAGDRIRTIAHGTAGHTRLPRYARNQPCRVETALGSYILADANAAGAPRPDWCYRVAFAACDLWGPEAVVGDSVTLDLWESYLEPAA
ncbi:MAG: nitrile hydratase subunit beta [Hyphomicrobiaceae bacterium]